MIRIFYALNTKPFTQEKWDIYLSKIPDLFQKKILKLVRWEDRHNSLAAKLMLDYGLQRLYNPPQRLESVKLSPFGKPFIENSSNNICFNISHSEHCSVCAFNLPDTEDIRKDKERLSANLASDNYENYEIGVDIERIKPIEVKDFFSVFTREEQQIITDSISPLHSFYNIWTRKESILKAQGSGLTNSLNKFCVTKNATFLNNNIWYTHPIIISPNYTCHIAVKQISPQISIQYISL